ncbi:MULTISPECIES: recombinase family protein [Streptomyces]|uniref:recombinase family protein n=1 Tax=Streptomyces TaxID=1883 RepID=UPI00131DAAB4|nr:recombinase family protein [Streptomyces avermitilis]MYT01136.1 recombinase family protein [Streptomyces sp. SID5469]
MTTQLRGVSVLRLSVLTDETTSPERQRAANAAAAAGLGIDLGDREAVDLGVSASKTTPFERPELGKWLRRPDDFDALCFWRFDRAVRSMADMDDLVKWARENKKVIVFAEGPGGRLTLDFRNGVDLITELILKIFAFAAQFEAQSIRERVISAQDAMRVMPLRWRGSRPPYGYMPAPLDGGGWTLAQDPEAVAVIERIILELMGDPSKSVLGKSAADVARGLNADGIPSPRDHWSLKKGRDTGGKTGGRAGETVTRGRFTWRHGSIKELLTSERMLGWKTQDNKPVRDSEGKPVMATAEPILTREEFDAIGAVLSERSVDNKKVDRVDTMALLLRIIHCEGCGQRMYLHRPSANSKSTSKTETYKCGALTRGQKCDAPSIIKREWAEEYVERQFLWMLGALEVTHTRTIPGYDPQPEIDATLAEFEEHQAQRGRQKSNAGKAAWQRHADSLDARLADLESREKTPPRVEEIRSGKTYSRIWASADTAGKRKMLQDAGAHLNVKRSSRGGWRKLDERRVDFTVRDPFFAEAASELTSMGDELAANG